MHCCLMQPFMSAVLSNCKKAVGTCMHSLLASITCLARRLRQHVPSISLQAVRTAVSLQSRVQTHQESVKVSVHIIP
jgi:hypothetical protein